MDSICYPAQLFNADVQLHVQDNNAIITKRIREYASATAIEDQNGIDIR